MAELLLDGTTNNDGLQLLWTEKAKTFKGGTGQDQGTRLVFGRAGGLGTECGLMAPVHPLGGHLRFLQDDEKSYARYDNS